MNREKRKDGPEVDRHELKLELIEDTGSAIVGAYRGTPGGGGTTEGSAALLSVFVKHFAQTGTSGTNLREVADMTKTSFYRALNDLLDHGDLANIGTKKRPFYMTAAKAKENG